MLIFTLTISCLTRSNLSWFMDLRCQIPMQYCSLALDFTFITRHIHNCVSFPLWPSHFILCGAISNCPPVFPSGILDTFQPEGLIFWCHIFLPFHTVHGILETRILEWFAIPFSSGPRFVRALHYDLSLLGGSARHDSWLHWVMKVPLPWQGCGPWRGA